MKKLTLNADPEVIATAHRLAKAQGTSVSAMFARMIRFLGRRGRSEVKLGRLTRQATGLAKLPKGKSDADVVADSLVEKYGLKP